MLVCQCRDVMYGNGVVVLLLVKVVWESSREEKLSSCHGWGRAVGGGVVC